MGSQIADKTSLLGNIIYPFKLSPLNFSNGNQVAWFEKLVRNKNRNRGEFIINNREVLAMKTQRGEWCGPKGHKHTLRAAGQKDGSGHNKCVLR
jgi:hypothetical protein